ncbi:hypothetical protein MUS1_03265 [Marinomonas ushuaiensis DSM 15871]|uniref:Oxidoreductase n=1 Tax=Marinomonas ushuaiensis DSM 15871 TaxID=1122207 RepID=X7EBW5_9GAMM|nr:DUF1289 domain-containing protein [Marinomonas ushuaiensis]ETX12618.1 hypothetical protein MUS1_03265 [Marinomonas ushuaiensis DSM 15871]
MEQIELFVIESPCKGICENSAKGFCKGCLRSREERFQWFSISNEARHHILDLCKQRRSRLLKARQERLDAHSEKNLPYGMEDELIADLFELTND